MDKLLIIILGNIVPMLCIVFAGILAYNKLEGWGWFLFIAFCCLGGGSGVKIKHKKSDDKPPKQL